MAHFVRRLIEITSRQQQTQCTLLDWLRMEYGIEKPSNKLLGNRTRFRHLGGQAWLQEWLRGNAPLPFPLSSAVEERGMTFSNGLPRVALADSLTRGYFLKPLRGIRDGVWNSPTAGIHPQH